MVPSLSGCVSKQGITQKEDDGSSTQCHRRNEPTNTHRSDHQSKHEHGGCAETDELRAEDDVSCQPICRSIREDQVGEVKERVITPRLKAFTAEQGRGSKELMLIMIQVAVQRPGEEKRPNRRDEDPSNNPSQPAVG